MLSLNDNKRGIIEQDDVSIEDPNRRTKLEITDYQEVRDQVNHYISTQGYGSPLKLAKPDGDIVRMLRYLQALIRQNDMNKIAFEELETKSRKWQNDYEILSLSQKRLRTKLEQSEKEADGLRMKLNSLEASWTPMNVLCSKLKEEIHKLRANYQNKDQQFAHELRKREKDLARLKDHLTRCMDRSLSGKFSVEILNPIERDNFGRADDKPIEQVKISNIEHYYSVTIEEMRQKEGVISKENQLLRNWLFGLSRSLPKIFELDEAEAHDDPEGIWNDHSLYSMPLDMSSEYIIQELTDLMENAKYQVSVYVSTLNQLQGRVTGLQKVEEAQEKIQRLEGLVLEQTKVIEEYLASEERKDTARGRWQHEAEEFEHKKKSFSEERKRLMEESQRLRSENRNLHLELQKLRSGLE